MSSPASARSRPPRAPLTGVLWLSARTALALRRTQRFRRWWLTVGGLVSVIALLLPVATRTPEVSFADLLAGAVADSLRSAEALRRAEARVATADSLLSQPAPVAPARTPTRSVRPDGSLAAAIASARDGRREDAVLALARHPDVLAGPRMRATAESLQAARGTPDAYRLAGTIIAMAEYRLRVLGDTLPARAASAALPAPARPDTALLAAIVRAERDTLDVARRRHEEARRAVVAAEEAAAAARRAVPPVSPGLAMLVIVGLGFTLRLALAVWREIREPTLAHALEAERAVGAPALSLVRDGLPDGPLRFRPSGVDPFRVLYLHLTSTGTRARSVLVTGEDGTIAAAVGARLAIAAAADHRTTLVAEWDTEQVALARVFRDHPEPGVSDVMAGRFTWRDVARSVGSSDGLSIAMLPAGSTPTELSDAQRATALDDFQRFRSGFEFTIAAVSLQHLAAGRALLAEAPIVLCASIGVTPVEALQRHAAAIEAAGATVHSLVLWDAPKPALLSRAELAAWLSKRKGRTPGGSFKAVQDAIKKPQSKQ